MLEELKECLIIEGFTFTTWLLNSNNPKVVTLADRFVFNAINKSNSNLEKDILKKVENECLQEILDILLKEPLADYFFYNSRGEISYSLPNEKLVPNDALKVDKEKIKIFLRDFKINSILK